MIAREPLAADALGSDVGGDLVAGGALLETGLAQRNGLSGGASANADVAPFVPGPGSPTDGTRVEAIDAPRSASAGAGRAAGTGTAGAAGVDDGLTADGPGGPGAPQGDVEAGGDISDSVDEAAGMDGSNAPSEAPPADAGAQGGQA
jgi:hypothetical protein